METTPETNGKLAANTMETCIDKTESNSFLVATSAPTLLSEFLTKAYYLNIELLPDDKRWLNIICFGETLPQLQVLLNQYTESMCA